MPAADKNKEKKRQFLLAQIPSSVLKVSGQTALGAISGFGTGLTIYLFASLGRLFKGMFGGDTVPGVDNVNLLETVGQGIVSLPGIGWMFRPIINGIFPMMNGLITKFANSTIDSVNKLPGMAIPPITQLGFFGWVGLCFPFIVGVKTLYETKQAQDAFANQLPDEWKRYRQLYQQYESARQHGFGYYSNYLATAVTVASVILGGTAILPAIGMGLLTKVGLYSLSRAFEDSSLQKPAIPKKKLPKLAGIAQNSFSVLTIERGLNFIKWAVNVTLGRKDSRPKTYEESSDAEKVQELDRFWFSTEFVSFGFAWYSALLTNPDDDNAIMRFLTFFSGIGASVGLISSVKNRCVEIEAEWLKDETKKNIGLSQDDDSDDEDNVSELDSRSDSEYSSGYETEEEAVEEPKKKPRTKGFKHRK